MRKITYSWASFSYNCFNLSCLSTLSSALAFYSSCWIVFSFYWFLRSTSYFWWPSCHSVVLPIAAILSYTNIWSTQSINIERLTFGHIRWSFSFFHLIWLSERCWSQVWKLGSLFCLDFTCLLLYTYLFII